ncbi:hypothetical protein [Streptomyces sp. NBC_00162]|uniref:hypothetical protein n=1 Tax=Streptomyces sp. NBC_00162 TaxID=2903629 RepID=UPI00214BE5AE|nr:hypothetical protein [Streptomyces sp. NBC_00162]UUU37673.1 hypothetical protein JIW86_01325 [Streptomyces sp. NBC_00162]
MSTTARLLTTAVLTSVLSGVAAPLASTAYAATNPTGIGWDVAPVNATMSASGSPANGIGWD